jgi:hypothetical protein
MISVSQGNPDYGSGTYRRRVRLAKRPGQLLAELEDTTHGFRLVLAHDGSRVTDIAVDPIRYPFDSCPGAAAMLTPLVGCPLATGQTALRSLLDPGQNCTHMYDLAGLALAHFSRAARERLYDISVDDEGELGAVIGVDCDGAPLHRWRVMSHTVVEPSCCEGKPMLRGFYPWASSMFSGDALEAAVVLHRGYFVAQSRRQDYMNMAGRSATQDKMPDGSCYTYRNGVVERAVHTGGMGRDFTNTADQLLKFL